MTVALEFRVRGFGFSVLGVSGLGVRVQGLTVRESFSLSLRSILELKQGSFHVLLQPLSNQKLFVGLPGPSICLLVDPRCSMRQLGPYNILA